MVVHVCDRCGKKLSWKEYDKQHFQIRHTCDRGSAFKWDHAWRDLCRTCGEELDSWLLSGKKKEEE